jgi:CDP-glucose 4,6-dehydratase
MLSSQFQGKKVLITGVTSFTGSWLSIWLHMMGAEIWGFSKNVPSPDSMFHVTGLNKTIKFRQLDILDAAGVAQFISEIKPDLLFHMAGQSLIREAVHTPLNTLSINILGTIHVLDALRTVNHACAAVFVSSDKSYKVREEESIYTETDIIGGEDPYSASKSSMEIIVRAYYKTYFSAPSSAIRIGIVRASNIIGGGDWSKDRIIPDCVRAWYKMEPLQIQSPYTVKPWQHVLDPLYGYLLYAQHLLLGNELNGETFNFGALAENIMTVQSLIDKLRFNWDGILPEPAYDVFPSERVIRSNLIRLNWDKANKSLGWEPKLDMNTALDFTAKWYTTYFNDQKKMSEITEEQISSYVKYLN